MFSCNVPSYYIVIMHNKFTDLNNKELSMYKAGK